MNYIQKIKNLLSKTGYSKPNLRSWRVFFSRPKNAYFITALNMILALILLGWFYRDIAGKTLLYEQPKTFNLAKFRPQTRYLVRQNDYLRGKSTPGAKVKVLLTKPKIKINTTADKNGNWRIKIPEKLTPRPYKMTIITFDGKGLNPKIRASKIKVESNNKILSSKAYKDLKNFYGKTVQKWL